jgi:glycosyltransferase involved in cell wall biosynthesis
VNEFWSLVIPAHNEEENIARVVTGAREVLVTLAERYEIVLVDDGSTDATVETARAALGADASNLTVVRHEAKSGYGATVRDGLMAAKGTLLSFMDGDGQFDPRDFVKLSRELQHADFVVGRRLHRADPKFRSVMSAMVNIAVTLLYGIRVRDVDCGMKVMKREYWDRCAPLLARSALINTEMLFKVRRLGGTTVQIPVQHLPRIAGKRSGGRLIPIMRLLRDILVLRWRLARHWRPSR